MVHGSGRRAARLLAALQAGALVVALAACTPGAEPERPEPAAIVEIDVPSELAPQEAVVDRVGIVPATVGLPWIVSGVRTEPGGVPEGVVWTLGEDGAVTGDPVALDLPGAVRGLAAAGGAARTFLAGSTWDEGRTSGFLLASADRATWAPVRLPPELAGVPLTHVSETGGTAVALGVDADARAVRGVFVPTTGEPVPLVLPEGEGRPTVQGVAGREATVVVAVSWDDEVGDDVVLTYRSADSGASWTTSEVPGDAPHVAGAAATGTGFVLAGSVREPGLGGPVSDAAAWFWEPGDGETWEYADFRRDDAGTDDQSTGLSAPAVGGEGLAAVYWGNEISVSSLVVEDASGRVRTQGMSDDNGGIGFRGPSAWVPDEHAVRAVLAGDGGAYVSELRDGRWRRLATLAMPQRWFLPTEVDAGDGGFVARRTEVSTAGDGWRRWMSSAAYTADGGTLVEGSADEPWTGEDLALVRSAAADGSEVMITVGWVDGEDAVRARSWFRPADGEWAEGSGWPSSGLTEVHDVRAVDGGWVAVGVRAESPEGASVRRAAAWRSEDGRTWTLDEGFEGGEGRSTARHVCLLGDGRPWVLGTVVEGGREVDTTWVGAGAGWERTVVDAEESFEVDGCVEGDDAARPVLQVQVDGRTELRGTTDGTTFDLVGGTGQGETFGRVVRVDGTYLAVGTVVATGVERRVLWWSADAQEWHQLPLPTPEPGSWGTVHPDGSDAVVTITGVGGVRAWRVRDVAQLVPAG
ncbi:hypothetical protein [Cellulosimicrobium protaetiae]|uniref:Exo-alpha-sialidase n=1 Tax=Cellulosimicrobium protaetiae TaxID=2587808 RepID=A0A6M5UCJ8_9MICO|nr:hypothetical protein [Cellulosimicrobium protaetiae]QJW36236.1 hypothetical protein FIC82_008495 [Cellulosimicrobium protaetiae]